MSSIRRSPVARMCSTLHAYTQSSMIGTSAPAPTSGQLATNSASMPASAAQPARPSSQGGLTSARSFVEILTARSAGRDEQGRDRAHRLMTRLALVVDAIEEQAGRRRRQTRRGVGGFRHESCRRRRIELTAADLYE